MLKGTLLVLALVGLGACDTIEPFEAPGEDADDAGSGELALAPLGPTDTRGDSGVDASADVTPPADAECWVWDYDNVTKKFTCVSTVPSSCPWPAPCVAE